MATSPILIWQPSGGSPPGAPGTTPPIYSQAGITQLIEGQEYVDVVFGSIQTDDEWILVAGEVENTTDFEPLNIWPGIITDRTAAGFRVQLNGLPDSGNYYLRWAVSGVNITPTPASTYFLTGSTSGPISAPTTFTVSLPPSTTLTAPVIVTPDDDVIVGTPGTFSPSFVTLTTGTPTATFTYTPASYGARTISTTNSGPLINPTGIVFTPVAVTYTLSGPSSGGIGVASTNFTVALPVGGVVAGTVTVTPHDASDGTFTPTTVALTTAAPSATFTYTPASTGTKTISVTNNGGLTNPAGLSYTIAFDPTTISGCKLWLKADVLALSDGATVNTWTDSSGLSNNFAKVGTPIYKTNIVNSLPVVRFNGSSDAFTATANLIHVDSTHYTIFAVVSSATVAATVSEIFSTGTAGLGCPIHFTRDTSDFKVRQYDGVTFLDNADTGGVAVGVWNVVTTDWNGSNMHLWRNGTLKGVTGCLNLGLAGTANGLGYLVVGATEFWNGDIAEVLVYAVALSTTDRQAVEAYLAAKYGL